MMVPTAFPVLIERAALGDAGAVHELLCRFLPAVRDVLRSRLGPKLRRVYETMDLQQSLARLLLAEKQHLADERWRTEHAFVRFLNVVAQRLVARKARHEHLAPEPAGNDVLDGAPGRDPGLSTAIGAREMFAHGAELFEDDWEVVSLRSEGWTFGDIAKQLGKQENAVRMQYHRALERVRRRLLGGDK